MPNRIVREGILTSEQVDILSADAELFYRRLMSVADDFGLFHGNVKLVRAACYPLRLDRVSDDDVRRYIDECRAAGVLTTPAVEGRQLIVLGKFGQQVRAKFSKYLPKATQEDIEGFVDAQQMLCKRAADAQQLQANAHLDGDGDGDGEMARSACAAARSPVGSRTTEAKGSRIPDDCPDAEGLAYCKTSRPELDPVEVAAKFRDYWRGVPGAKGRKLDWPATWRNFVRNEYGRGMNGKHSGTVIAHPSAASPEEAILRRISEQNDGLSVTRLQDGRLRCGIRYYRPNGTEEMAI